MLAVEWLGHERHVVCDLDGEKVTIREAGEGASPAAAGERVRLTARPGARPPVQPGHDRATELTAPVAPGAQEVAALETASTDHAPRGPRRGGKRAKDRLLAAAVLLPSAIIFVTFFFYPLYRLVYLGLHQQNRFGTAERYVGFSQYTDVLTGDNFLDGLRISATYVRLHRAHRTGARHPAGRRRQPAAPRASRSSKRSSRRPSPVRSRSRRSCSSC